MFKTRTKIIHKKHTTENKEVISKDNPLCQCGCGGEVSLYRGKWRRFPPLHHTQSISHRKAISNRMKGNTLYLGGKMSESARKTISERQKGEGNSYWKGGQAVISGGGYVTIYKPDHPFCYKHRVKEERLIMENLLGRYLTKEEIVHHKDRNKTNNDPSNLQVVDSSEHHKLHWIGRSRVLSEETRKNMALAQIGRKHSEETKRKMSISRKGKSRKPFSEETKRKMSEAAKKRKVSEETRLKRNASIKASWHQGRNRV